MILKHIRVQVFSEILYFHSEQQQPGRLPSVAPTYLTDPIVRLSFGKLAFR